MLVVNGDAPLLPAETSPRSWRPRRAGSVFTVLTAEVETPPGSAGSCGTRAVP